MITGFNEEKIQELIEEKANFETFFEEAELNPNAHLIKGIICGYRIEDIDDEFAKGRRMENSCLNLD